MYIVKTPKLVKNYLDGFIWQVPVDDKRIFLTFDDGPIPEVTPWVLETLAVFQARASFFCVGDNVFKYPEVFKQVIEQGHTVGNHTYNHLNGWNTPQLVYLENVYKCAELVSSNLFRPPYGRIRAAQRSILAKDFKFIMWDVLSGDFDPAISNEKCLENVIRYTEAGSIIVMHDSLKAEKKLRYVLPRVLEHFTQKGFEFAPILDRDLPIEQV
ncbi:MAG: polysaccharide deacetylase family protein [Saprospiraceae bacterium]